MWITLCLNIPKIQEKKYSQKQKEWVNNDNFMASGRYSGKIPRSYSLRVPPLVKVALKKKKNLFIGFNGNLFKKKKRNGKQRTHDLFYV